MTVVDASVLVAALIVHERHGAWSEAVISSGPLFAPAHAPAEVTNILRRLERANVISRIEANEAHEDLSQLDIELFPFGPFAPRIWELRHGMTRYDAWYVALAEALAIPLATLDQRLAKAGGATCEFLAPPDI